MSSEVVAWLGQVPWGPDFVVAALAALGLASSLNARKTGALVAGKLAAGAVVIDVRTKAEYAGGHFDGARNIPLDVLASQLKKLGAPATPLVVYCASGARSAQAVSALKAAGYTDVTNGGGLSNLRRLARSGSAPG